MISITAMCISCKARREIDGAESRRLTEQHRVPTCEVCGMPMIAVAALSHPLKTAERETGGKC
jgi:hypothetical protein